MLKILKILLQNVQILLSASVLGKEAQYNTCFQHLKINIINQQIMMVEYKTFNII